MTRKDFSVITEILAQIIWDEECLGGNVRDNAKAIDYILQQVNANYNPDKFWQAVEKNVLELKGIFAEKA